VSLGNLTFCRIGKQLATLFAIALVAGPALAERIVTEPELTVDGTAFVLRLPDGQVRRGTQLQGATIHLVRPGGVVAAVKLARVEPDPNDPAVLRHDFRVQDAQGQWNAICEPNFDGETFGFPLALPPGHPGREGPITLTCASGAVGKCVRFGYKPWLKGPQGEDLTPYHAACVHMVRADYCGDDRAHTKNGTTIDLYDRIGIQSPVTLLDPEFAFEAGWTPNGATCVARTRWGDVAKLADIAAECPALPRAPDCSESSAAAGGALLYNRSRMAARIGH
jgi:hypothetical protein